MSVDKKQAAQDLKFFAKRLQGVLSLAEDVSALDDMEGATKHALEQRDQANVALNEANRQVKNSEAELNAVIADIKAAEKEAATVRDEIIAVANTEAKHIVAEAQIDADAIADEAAKTSASLQDGIAIAQNQLSEVTQQLAAANAELDRVNTIIAEAKARL